MRVIELESGVAGYRSYVEYVRQHGEKRSPRGLSTLDVGPMTVVIHDVTESLPLGVGRNASRKIAAAESIQLIGGFSQPSLLTNASNNFSHYLEHDGEFHGAYGRRIGDQLSTAIYKIKDDVDTRQAVITLWDARLDNVYGKKDYPCTVALNLALVRDRLNLNVVMRSQDVWLGTPFDWAQFTQLQQTVANVLSVETGPYTHTTWSTHLYEQNFADVDKLTDPPARAEREWQPRGIGYVGDSIHTVLAITRALVSTNNPHLLGLTESERWYRDQLSSLLS